MWCVVSDGFFSPVAGARWSMVSITPFEPEMIPSVALNVSAGHRSRGGSIGEFSAVAYWFQGARAAGAERKYSINDAVDHELSRRVTVRMPGIFALPRPPGS